MIRLGTSRARTLCLSWLAGVAFLAQVAQASQTTIASTWWTDEADGNNNSCFESSRLHWDPDVSGSGNKTIYEKIYYRKDGDATWILLATTSAHTINGVTTSDAQYVDVPEMAGKGRCANFDYRIEIYLSGPDTLDYTRDASGDSVLNNHPEEGIPDLTLVYDGQFGDPYIQIKTFPAGDCAIVEGYTSEGTRKLLRFAVYTVNIGSADVFKGTPADNPGLYIWSPCHQHYHLQNYAEFRLLQGGNPVMPGRKDGFCLLDNINYNSSYAANYDCNFQGLTPGWGDVYTADTDGQWVDVTGVAPGSYTIEVKVNPTMIIKESNYNNNTQLYQVSIPNTTPSISDVSNQSTSVNTPTGAIPFTISDLETDPGSMTVAGSSSNTGLVPNGNISLGGSGANRNVTITPAANQNGTATITLTVTDANGASASDTFVLTVTGSVNQAPVVTTSAGSSSFSENGGAVAVDNALTVTDDGANLVSATVSFAAGFQSGQDVLAFSPSGGISGSYDSGTGVLSLTGSSSVGSYQAVLRSVTYNNTSENPNTAARSISFLVNDGAATGSNARSVTVTSVNDAPVIALPDNPLSYTEGDQAVVIDPTATATDVDSANFHLGSLTVTLTVNGSADDRLGILDEGSGAGQFGLSGTTVLYEGIAIGHFSGGSGTTPLAIAFDTTPTVVPPAVAQELMRSITFHNVSLDASTAQRTVQFVMSDGDGGPSGGNSAAVTETISVLALNQSPVVTTSAGSVTFVENASPQTVDGAVTVVDSDTANLTGGSVSLTAGFQSGQDVLAVVNQGGVSGSYDSGTGVLTLSGTASVATYQSVLRSLTYQNTSDAPNTAARTVTFSVSDGSGNGSATRGVNVTAVNDEPTLASISDPPAILEDSGPQVMNLSGVGAGGGETQVLSMTSGSANSAVVPDPGVSYTSPNGTGSVSYTPVANAFGSAVVTVTVQDDGGTDNGGDNSISRMFTVVVTGVNDAPSFVKGADQTVAEDAGAQSVSGWATAISPGPGEGAQTVYFVASSDNPSLFGAGPAVSPEGVLSFTPAANASGSATVTVRIHDNGGTANGGVDTSAPQTFTITVNAVNDAPSFTKGADQVVAEDAGAQTVSGWATGMSAGANESGQGLDFVVSVENGAFFSAGPAVAADGTLTYTVAANATGGTTVTVRLHDDGGTANGGVDTSEPQTFTITANGINDVPSFAKGADQNVLEDAGPQSVSGWATAISAGPGEGTQAVDFIVNNDNPSLFSSAPAVSALGTLTFTPAANASGSATVSVQIHDDGGTANGGVDTSASQTFVISVTALNDAPSFVRGVDQTVAEDSGGQTSTGWATSIDAGPDESGQGLDFILSTDNPGLFSVAPAVATDGTLTFTPAANAFGSATVTVRLHDDGGTSNGGSDTSAPQTFTVTVTGINDAPSFTKGADQVVLEDAGAQTVAGWATGISAGAGEGAQSVDFIVSNNNPALFSAAPAISPSGALSFTPAANANGLALVTVHIHDDGGTLNGGVDTSGQQTFNITVTAVNDAPTLDAIRDQNVAHDAGAQTVNFGGVESGAVDESGQEFTITAVSSNPGVVPNPSVTYTSPNAAGSLSYTPTVGQGGTVQITVTVTDDGGVANGGVNTFERQFDVTVVPPGAAPFVATTSGALSYQENAGAVAVDSTVTITDGDSSELTGGAVSITSAFQSGQDVLAFVDQGGVTGSYNSGTGVLTLSGTASVGTYQTALRSVTYQNTSDAPSTASRTVTFSVSDGSSTGSATRGIQVAAVNDEPTLSAMSDPVAILEDSGLQTVNFDGVGAGAGEAQTLTVSAVSGNTAVVPNPGVSYTSPNGSGSLSYAPVANGFGSAVITVTVQDDGGTANGGDNSVSRTFTVAVTGVNDAPSFVKGADQTVNEDAGAQTVAGWATFIDAGPGESSQAVDFIVSEDNPALFAVGPAVSAAGTLTFTPAADAHGSATVTVRIHDDGGTDNGGVDTSGPQTFTITVSPVNDAPSLAALSGMTMAQDAGLQSVALSGISSGPANEGAQILSVTAVSSNPGLIPNPTVNYTSPESTGSLSFTPVAGQSGDATITVTVNDGGGTANAGVEVVERTFTVEVTPGNVAPTVTASAGALGYVENGGAVALDLGLTVSDGDDTELTGGSVGISSGFQSGQDVLAVVNQGGITGSYDTGTGVLTLSGTASVASYQTVLRSVTYQNTSDSPDTTARTVTFTLSDGTASGSATRGISITAVNDEPTLAGIADPVAILEDSGLQTLTFSGVGAGDGEVQTLTVSAVSGNTGVVPNPSVTYTSPGTSGSLSYAPVANAFGTATVTVTVQDNGGTANGGDDTMARTFTVAVTGVNDVPSFLKGADQLVAEDSGAQSVVGWASAINAGPGEGGQAVDFLVSNDNPSLFAAAPAVSASGTLTFTPAADASGSATVTVRIHDNGGTANGGLDTSAPQTFTITVTPVVDPPTVTTSAGSLAYTENAAAAVIDAGLVLSNPDGASLIGATASFLAGFASGEDDLAFTPEGGITGSYDAGTGVLSLSGAASLADYQAALRSVTYHNSSDSPSTAARTVRFLVDTGSGTGSGTRGITVTAVNDAPVITLTPGAAEYLEKSPKTIIDPTLTLSDVDSAALTSVSVRITTGWHYSDDLLDWTPQGGLSGGYNPATGILTVSGTASVAVYESVLRSVTYFNWSCDPRFASRTIVYSATDGSATGTASKTLTILLVNHSPLFDPIAPPSAILEDAGVQSVTVPRIRDGCSEGQTLFLTAGSSDPLLVADPTVSYVSPSITGTLTYTPEADANGSATITVTLQDSGGTANGGIDTHTQTFSVSVLPVNDAPSFTQGGDVTVAQNSGAQSFAGWATAVSAGPADEAAQTVSFLVTHSSPGLFTVGPAVSPAGVLTFTPASFVRGSGTITVRAQDSGGTANGGVDTSAVQTFVITIGSPTDTDGDLMPDDWELVYGFDPGDADDGGTDLDGDGFSNSSEYLASTGPTDPSSSPGITSTVAAGADVRIGFRTVAGKSYRIERNHVPGSDSWSIVADNVAGTGGVVQVTDAGAASLPKCFYRAVVLP